MTHRSNNSIARPRRRGAFGHRFADRLLGRWIHAAAAVLCIVLGGLALRTALLSG